MNKNTLLAASAVIALGFVSCGDDTMSSDANDNSASTNSATIILDGQNIAKLEQKVEDSDGIEVAISGLFLILFADESASVSESCEGGGSTDQNLVVDSNTGEADLNLVYAQCTSSEGAVINGELDYHVDAEETTPITIEGYFEITGLPTITSLKYDDFDMTYLDGNSVLESNITITSDDISGTVNYKMVAEGEVTTTTVTGANNTKFVYVYDESVFPETETCTLNGAAVSCE